ICLYDIPSTCDTTWLRKKLYRGVLGPDGLIVRDDSTQLCLCKGVLGADGPTIMCNFAPAEGRLGQMVPRHAKAIRSSTGRRSGRMVR
ncbi:hypothetical protein BHM03_00037607, partial [Ensete ventricosum]